jgi:hypothetical protein
MTPVEFAAIVVANDDNTPGLADWMRGVADEIQAPGAQS